MRHENNGNCPMCDKILDRYKGFHKPLRKWFKDLQAKHPETHTSCAGRGQMDQEACFIRGASKAKWTQSGHNYNVALDLFEMAGDDIENIYEKKWFDAVIKPNIPEWMEWYGKPGSLFKELPHVELKDWKRIKSDLKLVENIALS